MFFLKKRTFTQCFGVVELTYQSDWRQVSLYPDANYTEITVKLLCCTWWLCKTSPPDFWNRPATYRSWLETLYLLSSYSDFWSLWSKSAFLASFCPLLSSKFSIIRHWSDLVLRVVSTGVWGHFVSSESSCHLALLPSQ